MDTGFKHTHVLVVTLYLLQLLIKVVLIATGKKEQFEKFSQKTKIPHIVLASLMLVTGGYLLVVMPKIDSWVIVKLVLVFASIPLGVVGAKRFNTPMIAASLIILAYLFPLSMKKNILLKSDQALIETAGEEEADAGLERALGLKTYQVKCQQCHGEDGAGGYQGAKNLAVTELTDAEIVAMVKEGKNMMPPNPDLTEDQIQAVVQYIKKFKQ